MSEPDLHRKGFAVPQHWLAACCTVPVPVTVQIPILKNFQ
jgi:hypothetical protein